MTEVASFISCEFCGVFVSMMIFFLMGLVGGQPMAAALLLMGSAGLGEDGASVAYALHIGAVGCGGTVAEVDAAVGGDLLVRADAEGAHAASGEAFFDAGADDFDGWGDVVFFHSIKDLWVNIKGYFVGRKMVGS